jgi:Na+-transporting NADH:ubiquinone oxidoreductase subunit NqrC
MFTPSQKIDKKEKALLLKAPVLVSVLASVQENHISFEGKAGAIKLAHLKTFTAHPRLIEYYKEVDQNFEKIFDAAVLYYSPFDDDKLKELKNEIYAIQAIILKLDKDLSSILKTSLEGYVKHVKKASRGLIDNFIFPIHINGLSA